MASDECKCKAAKTTMQSLNCATMQVQNLLLVTLREVCGSSGILLFNRIQSVQYSLDGSALIGLFSYSATPLETIAEVSGAGISAADPKVSLVEKFRLLCMYWRNLNSSKTSALCFKN